MTQVGDVIEQTRTFSQEDFNPFAALSGDDNPIHVDPEFAAKTHFGRTVSHGMLLYSTVCGVIDRHFPGAQQISQELMFPTGTPTGEEVTIRLRVEAVQGEGREALLETLVIRPNGDIGLQGRTWVRLAVPA